MQVIHQRLSGPGPPPPLSSDSPPWREHIVHVESENDKWSWKLWGSRTPLSRPRILISAPRSIITTLVCVFQLLQEGSCGVKITFSSSWINSGFCVLLIFGCTWQQIDKGQASSVGHHSWLWTGQWEPASLRCCDTDLFTWCDGSVLFPWTDFEVVSSVDMQQLSHAPIFHLKYIWTLKSILPWGEKLSLS